MSEELKAPEGWEPLVGEGWLEALHCRYPDGQDVVVLIDQKESGYEVRERADLRGSGPKETVAGSRESRAAARELMLKTCREWDSWILRRPTSGCN
jgi:hypothetical protein